MAEGYAIDHESLATHESDIRDVMDQVKGAVDQVRGLFDVQAFGVVGTIWATPLNAWIEAHTSCIDTAVAAGTKVADNVRSMNENYQTNEQNVAGSFTAIDGDLKGA
jgi:hypothetical protein